MKNKVWIFGEMHTKEDRDRIEEEIIELHRKVKFKYLLSEEVGSLIAKTDKEKEAGIKGRHYSISPRSYELGIRLGIPVIGIDSWADGVHDKDVTVNGEYVDCSRSFELRETRMAKVISQYGDMGNCAVIVGDTHLRGIPTKVMGDISIIVKEHLCDPNVFVVRSPVSEVNENGIVVIFPQKKDYKLKILERISDLSNALSNDENQYSDKRYDKFFPPEKLAFNPAYFSDKENGTVYCSVVNNQIIAFVYVIDIDDKSFKISMAFTDPAYRRQGHARKLFNYIFEQYPKDKYIGFIGARLKNKNAIAFYERCGFAQYHVSMVR